MTSRPANSNRGQTGPRRSRSKSVYQALGRDPVHPFPARMAPDIVIQHLSQSRRRLRVLDPMAGSGTVLALALAQGHSAVGVDIDPLAVLISTVWTSPIDKKAVRKKAREVLARARTRFEGLTVRDAYPRSADAETCEFVRYWFDPYARRQLASLASAIGGVRDSATRNVLWCAFSRLIITKQSGASLAMDLSHSRPHRVFDRAPAKPFRRFLAVADRVVSNCPEKQSRATSRAAVVRRGDARRLPLQKGSVDVVLTSPPYLNAIDYLRCSKFSLVWMGYGVRELRGVRGESIGAELGDAPDHRSPRVTSILKSLRLPPAASDSRFEAMLARYIGDMDTSMREVARVLREGGKAVYVIGENTIRGTYVRNSKIVTSVAELNGLKLVRETTRTLPASRRYLPPPRLDAESAALNARIRREVILSFSKPESRAGVGASTSG